MFRNIARKPIPKIETYLKYGFVLTEHECHFCPRCGQMLNAGPNYQPWCCDKCGQRITFNGVEWKSERTLGYLSAAERENYAQVKNRMGG